MFSGIVEALGVVKSLTKDGSNLNIMVQSTISNELHIDQSLSHNGICLTVVGLNSDTHTVTAIEETLIKTNLGVLSVGDKINLERAMKIDGMLDGHIVQGHVDTTAVCSEIDKRDGSTYYTFVYEPSQAEFVTVEKGSSCINGVSLTVINSQKGQFQVAIIPYTDEHTNFHCFKVGSVVNLEFDILGKYILKYMAAFKSM